MPGTHPMQPEALSGRAPLVDFPTATPEINCGAGVCRGGSGGGTPFEVEVR